MDNDRVRYLDLADDPHFIKEDVGWYFKDKSGVLIGPFESKLIAEIWLQEYLDFYGQEDQPH